MLVIGYQQDLIKSIIGQKHNGELAIRFILSLGEKTIGDKVNE